MLTLGSHSVRPLVVIDGWHFSLLVFSCNIWTVDPQRSDYWRLHIHMAPSHSLYLVINTLSYGSAFPDNPLDVKRLPRLIHLALHLLAVGIDKVIDSLLLIS